MALSVLDSLHKTGINEEILALRKGIRKRRFSAGLRIGRGIGAFADGHVRLQFR